MTPLTAKISAILTAKSNATLLHLCLREGDSAWHQSETKLILKDQRGDPLPCNLRAYGLLMADNVLIHNHTYHIHGPVGVDPNSGAFIKHSCITQTLVATVPPQQGDLAAKAWINSTGKVLRVVWDNVSEEGEWHLTVQAEHEIFNPDLSEMEDIQVNTMMTFEGLVISKDQENNELIVQVLSHGFVA
ncbi:uncharacterized protein MELLADRAFT_84420 [Melampsora larici-populina 98AG31]|uniref:Uncharacterized protein n=1 Tax=Melampsora larici-populina (strain 98AG31 / pathotype 3-4-7) TaxID=747676 RepID=F4RFP6_MELLP|nr:uncharacterized protein MELLADRAFT_84420 [Melampsora larici-populina 98AG31]EGG08896.1 hypothetical protein MELLADRAFT_84420 [Melampsora larici-populina 98AG31]